MEAYKISQTKKKYKQNFNTFKLNLVKEIFVY